MADVRGSRFSRRALIAGGALATAGGAVLALRGSGHGRHSFADNQTLHRGNFGEPDTLDPHLALSIGEMVLVGDLFLGLMTEDSAGQPVAGAAESYRVSEDGFTYTFRLRDHRWSDGMPVTAEDFVYSLRRVLDPKIGSHYAAILSPIRNADAVNAGEAPPEALAVRALDARTLEIGFAVDVPYAGVLFAHCATYPVPRHVIEKHGEYWTQPGVLVGNGAYALREWVPNDHITLEKNPHFYDAGRVKIARAVVLPTQDFAASLTRFRAGELDIDVNVPSQDIAWVRRKLPGGLHIAPYMMVNIVLFNLGAKPVDDWRVRSALSLAIDRETIAERVMGAGEAPAYSFIPPHMPNYPGTAELSFRHLPMRDRLVRARALLAEAGYGPSNRLAFDFNIVDQTTVHNASVALQSMWREIGADVRIVLSDAKAHINLLMKEEYSVAWGQWAADYLDARNFLVLGETSAHHLNDSGFSDPRFDALMARSDHISDVRARGACMAQAEQILLDAVAIAPVYFSVSRTLVSPAVAGWVDNAINAHRTRWLSLERGRTIA